MCEKLFFIKVILFTVFPCLASFGTNCDSKSHNLDLPVKITQERLDSCLYLFKALKKEKNHVPNGAYWFEKISEKLQLYVDKEVTQTQWIEIIKTVYFEVSSSLEPNQAKEELKETTYTRVSPELILFATLYLFDIKC